MTPQYIWLDSNGKETKRQDKGRGRPRSDAEHRSDGNWYIVEGAVKPSAPVADRPQRSAPVNPASPVYIVLRNGVEIDRRPKGRGRPAAGAEKRADGNWYIEEGAVVQRPAVTLPAHPRATKSPVVGAGKVIAVRSSVSIITPSGKCPVKLESLDSIGQWRDEVISHYARRGQKIGLEGVSYFVRHFYAYGTPEHQAAIAALQPPQAIAVAA